MVSNFRAYALPLVVVFMLTSCSWALHHMNERGRQHEWKQAYEAASGRGVKLALLDSGVAVHARLKPTEKWDFTSGEPLPDVTQDSLGHGTAVAGIAAAEPNRFMQGVAPHVKWYSLRVLNEHGMGHPSHVVRALEWCLERGMQVVVLSSGYRVDDKRLQRTLERMTSAGVIVIAAAGNQRGGPVDYPAAYGNVISAGALNDKREPADFSARGKIDVSVPAVRQMSTSVSGGYAPFSGTSIAAAHVAGMAARLLERPAQFDIDMTQTEQIAEQVKKVLQILTESS